MTVYPRDASWHDHPGRAHALHSPEDPAAPMWAACAPGRIVLSDMAMNVEEVPASALCRRPACVRARKAAASSSGDGAVPAVELEAGTPADGEACVFCAIVAGPRPDGLVVVEEWADALAFVPLAPVTPGHTLVIPKTHVRDISVDRDVSAATVRRAVELMERIPSLNMITSKGAPATQTVYHLHLHLVPRVKDDKLALPWTGQHRATVGPDGDGGDRTTGTGTPPHPNG